MSNTLANFPNNQQPNIVVDVTYLCNATCRYCRWGSSKTPQRTAQSLKDILIPAKTLKDLQTKQIVISGGEPRLHPEIEQILNYYSNLADVTIITNGIGLTVTEVEKLLQAGATGFTVSLDSVDVMESFITRSTPPHLHREILSNLEKISKNVNNFKFGINSVVSHITSNWTTVKGILEFGARLGVDFVKFQPIFDDGYASKNAPELLLSNEDTASLSEIANKLDTIEHPLTNSPGFWTDLAAVTSGVSLPAHQCGMNSSQSISVRGNLSICYWVDSSLYGASSTNVKKKDLIKIQTNFEEEKKKCKVDFHCFCNQRIDHVWLT